MRRILPGLVLAALLLPGALPQAPAPCAASDVAISCRWEFSTEDGAALPHQPRAFDLPVFDETMVTIEVTLIGLDQGWTTRIEAQRPDGSWAVVSSAQHAAVRDPSYRHASRSAHLVLDGLAAPHRLVVIPYVADDHASLVNLPVASGGRYTITSLGERVPAGEIPARPAATRDDPHLLDIPREVEEGQYDILAAWFDDARVGDGLFDVHLALAALTADVPVRDPLGLPANEVRWKLAWTLEATRYQVEWIARPVEGGGTWFSCELRTDVTANDVDEPVLAHPACEVDLDNATLHAVIPERSLGMPREGVLFETPEARTRIFGTARTPDVVDDATEARYLFALGGPRVWSGLDGGRKDPPAPAFYEDPFAVENLADTLQVLGSIAALSTFLVGVALVARRRRHTGALLARVDAIADEGLPPAQTLRALGRLEEEFTLLFRRHRITDAQYQVLTQRIAGVATRFALRSQLGLDDGVPGEPGVQVSVRERGDRR